MHFYFFHMVEYNCTSRAIRWFQGKYLYGPLVFNPFLLFSIAASLAANEFVWQSEEVKYILPLIAEDRAGCDMAAGDLL